MSDNPPTKVAVSVADMARMAALSRARFYQLMKAGVFPPPERQPGTNRPYYSAERQQLVLDVRRRNLGINGHAVLFYARRLPTGPAPARPPRSKPPRARPAPTPDPHAGLIAALEALGLTGLKAARVAEVVAATFPGGTAGVDEGEVVREVFLRLKVGTL